MLTIFLIFSSLGIARAERPTPPRTGTIDVGAVYSYFTTSSNYDSGGSKVGDPNGGGLSTNSVLLDARYDFNAHLRFAAGLQYNDTSTTDGFFDRDNSAIVDFPLGVQYFGALKRFLWVAQGDVGITPYKVDEGADQVAIAEGVNRVRGGGWLIYRGGQIQPYAYLAGEYRDGGRSSLIPYAAGSHFKIDNFWLQGEVRGFFALGNDSDSALADRARREAFLARVNGGSFRYYGVNPSLHEIGLDVGWRFSQFNVYAGGSMTLAGSSTAQGWGAVVGLRWAIPTAPSRSRDTSYQGPSEGYGFETKEESYDETLFNDRPVIRKPTPPPPSLDDASPPSSPPPSVQLIPKKKKKRRRNLKQERQQQNLDKLLNETEHGLEGN